MTSFPFSYEKTFIGRRASSPARVSRLLEQPIAIQLQINIVDVTLAKIMFFFIIDSNKQMLISSLNYTTIKDGSQSVNLSSTVIIKDKLHFAFSNTLMYKIQLFN